MCFLALAAEQAFDSVTVTLLFEEFWSWVFATRLKYCLKLFMLKLGPITIYLPWAVDKLCFPSDYASSIERSTRAVRHF